MTTILDITIPDPELSTFYSLYAYGQPSRKLYLKESVTTLLSYPEDSVIFLFYTYPTHREACAIRNVQAGTVTVSLPGLSKKVSLLFSVHASRVDKLRRAITFLDKQGLAYSQDDGFYIRLFFVLSQKGSLNYAALTKLTK